MQLEVNDAADDVTRVALVGRLDISGCQEVDLKFHAVTAARGRPAIIDLTQLDYIASLGMGMLISGAKGLNNRGHKLVLVGAHDTVDLALRSAGIDQAIPMVADADEALAVIQQG